MIGRLLFVLLATLATAGAACGGPPAPKTVDFPHATQCVGGLCVRPDHAIARRITTIDGKRCLIVAWDGRSDLPPTAKVANTDESPAAAGVFLSIELPTLRSGVPYAISSEPKASTTVLSAQVSPSVQFTDRRIASAGYVTVLPSGDDLLVIVQTKWEGGREETAQFVVTKAQNGCGAVL